MSDTKLKPCLCGGKPVIEEYERFVFCSIYDCPLHNVRLSVRNWNTRALNGVTIPQAVVAKTISVLKQYRDEAFIQEERWDDLLQDLIAKLQQAIGGGK